MTEFSELTKNLIRLTHAEGSLPTAYLYVDIFRDKLTADYYEFLLSFYVFHADQGNLVIDDDDTEWFYSIYRKVEERLYLSAYRQGKIIKRLRDEGWIRTRMAGIPPKQYVNITDKMASFLSQKNFANYHKKTLSIKTKKIGEYINNKKEKRKKEKTSSKEDVRFSDENRATMSSALQSIAGAGNVNINEIM